MLGLLGKKVGMTQIFNEEGKQVPVTVLQVGPCYVTDIRTDERDGYSSVQVGFHPISDKRVNKAKKGHLAKSSVKGLRYLREMRTKSLENVQLGQKLLVDNFEVGDWLDIQGVSKGRGYQGVVKRHGFRAGEAAHGSKFGREIGSVGASAFPSRVIKGLGMPGQMGGYVVTTQNIQVVKVDVENNLLLVRGPVPGANDQLLKIMLSLKKSKDRNWKVLSSEQMKDVVVTSEESSDEKSTVGDVSTEVSDADSSEK